MGDRGVEVVTEGQSGEMASAGGFMRRMERRCGFFVTFYFAGFVFVRRVFHLTCFILLDFVLDQGAFFILFPA